MNKATQYLISKDNGKLQIPYEDYVVLMEKAEEAKRIAQVKKAVLADLETFLYQHTGESSGGNVVVNHPKASAAPVAVQKQSIKQEKVEDVPASPAVPDDETKAPAAKNRTKSGNVEIPPIKKEIAEHFNRLDESGRLLNVFRQYYTCINDTCGGTVRVTMKDGFCSLWNYDEWEEFSFVDIFEGGLRFAVDPRYTDDLSALDICEVPRLLSSRRNLVCVKVGDLNKTMLNVLGKAFEEVGTAAS